MLYAELIVHKGSVSCMHRTKPSSLPKILYFTQAVDLNFETVIESSCFVQIIWEERQLDDNLSVKRRQWIFPSHFKSYLLLLTNSRINQDKSNPCINSINQAFNSLAKKTILSLIMYYIKILLLNLFSLTNRK